MGAAKATTRIAMCCALLLSGCAAYRIPSSALRDDPGPLYMQSVRPVAQQSYQCGPAALESVLSYWGVSATADEISRELYTPGARGILNFLLAQYARRRGFWTEIHTGDAPDDLRAWLARGVPPIVMLRVGPRWLACYHFVVLTGFNARDDVWYANTGAAQTQAIPDRALRSRWKDAQRWALVICPPERVDWPLEAARAAELGWLLEQSGRLSVAAQRYREALTHQPADSATRFRLANIYLKTQQLSEATGLYVALLRDQPGHGGAVNNLAWIFIEEGQSPAAIRLVEDAFQRGVERTYDMLDTLGWAQCQAGQSASGRQYLHEALAAAPLDHPAAAGSIRAHLASCR